MVKKSVCILLSIVLLLYCTPVVQAFEASSSSSDFLYSEDYTVTKANLSQVVNNHQYLIDLTLLSTDSTTNPQDAILSYCTLVDSFFIDAYCISVYESNYLAKYVPLCKSITEITMIDDKLYIRFETTDGKSVVLTYLSNGLDELCIYNPRDDTAFYEVKEYAVIYNNLKSSGTVTMSDELLAKIDTLIEQNDFVSLQNIEGISIDVSDDGLLIIEPEEVQNARASGFTSESSLLGSLKSRFPQYNETSLGVYYLHCTELNSSVRVKVTESRNNYIKKSASWGNFVVGTAITIISTAMSLPITAIVAILTGLGILIDANQTITEAVKLAKSAIYKYTGTRAGFAYDTTIHNAYVRVVTYSDSGEFTGGYTADGNFEWVISDPSTAYERSADTIANTTISYYNSAFLWMVAASFISPIEKE